jgi:hypothetical protein
MDRSERLWPPGQASPPVGWPARAGRASCPRPAAPAERRRAPAGPAEDQRLRSSAHAQSAAVTILITTAVRIIVTVRIVMLRIAARCRLKGPPSIPPERPLASPGKAATSPGAPPLTSRPRESPIFRYRNWPGQGHLLNRPTQRLPCDGDAPRVIHLHRLHAKEDSSEQAGGRWWKYGPDFTPFRALTLPSWPNPSSTLALRRPAPTRCTCASGKGGKLWLLVVKSLKRRRGTLLIAICARSKGT